MNNISLSAISADQVSITPFQAKYQNQVSQLLDAAFGADRQQKSSYKLRESSVKIDDLSLIASQKNQNGEDVILASIAYWQLDVAGEAALLLGPLAVNPDFQGMGLGRRLMDETLSLAQKIAGLRGWKFTILIGDLDYYQKSGFQRVPHGAIDYPQPTDPNRVLYFEFEPHSLQQLIDNNDIPLRLNHNE
ncbi:MAG: N-acetyltransferase [OCS116 cluster bacterium]|uniref:GNAT family N-acetyltransferase n=1 Tax=OCS116 cluster bacterium TaxID=2030921 RepID=A0A2A4YPZ9_9PROT|nr:N-acetyltransferase [OCS116 cluster bacterium]